MLYRIATSICGTFCSIFFGVKVIGKENIPRKGGFILASNHMSNLDPVLLGCFCYRRINFMAKQELFRNKFFGWLIRQLAAFPVKRGTADLGAIRELLKRVKGGQGCVIFPEGSRQPEGKLGKAHEGIGFLASKLGVPVLPALITGSGTALPPGASKLNRVPITIKFGKLINIDSKMPYQQIADRIMEEIQRLSC